MLDTPLPQLLTPLDVALWLSLPTTRVIRMARQGLIPCVMLPDGELVFDREELRCWLDQWRQVPLRVVPGPEDRSNAD